MNEVWNELINYWEQYAPIRQLGLGADSDEIDILGMYLDVKLPNKFKEFYKIHNGCGDLIVGPHPSRILSLEEILQKWKMLNSMYLNEEDEFVESSNEVKNVQWNRNWIPFTNCSRGRDYYCLDFDPTKDGTKGQVIFFSVDLGDREFIAISFESFMSNLL